MERRHTQETAAIVAGYARGNAIAWRDLPAMIVTVHGALAGLGQAPAAVEVAAPAVSAKKSVTPDYLVSLETGERFKSLKRHLAGRGLTPKQYRQKWGLAFDYPMVAPNYAAQRSTIAKQMGLGRHRAKPAAKVGRAGKVAA